MNPWMAQKNVRFLDTLSFRLPSSLTRDVVRVALCLHYTDAYPDELPEMSLKVNQGSIDDTDLDGLVSQLREAV
jgi:hypothetical protein